MIYDYINIINTILLTINILLLSYYISKCVNIDLERWEIIWKHLFKENPGFWAKKLVENEDIPTSDPDGFVRWKFKKEVVENIAEPEQKNMKGGQDLSVVHPETVVESEQQTTKRHGRKGRKFYKVPKITADRTLYFKRKYYREKFLTPGISLTGFCMEFSKTSAAHNINFSAESIKKHILEDEA